MSMSESVTEFSEVLPPPTSSSVGVGGGVAVVVGRCGGTDCGT